MFVFVKLKLLYSWSCNKNENFGVESGTSKSADDVGMP